MFRGYLASFVADDGVRAHGNREHELLAHTRAASDEAARETLLIAAELLVGIEREGLSEAGQALSAALAAVRGEL